MAKPAKSQRFLKPTLVDIGDGKDNAKVVPRVVRFPGGTALPEAGALVSMYGAEGAFWTRRLEDGSVKEVPPNERPQSKSKGDAKPTASASKGKE